jgi:hypothetical protein
MDNSFWPFFPVVRTRLLPATVYTAVRLFGVLFLVFRCFVGENFRYAVYLIVGRKPSYTTAPNVRVHREVSCP